MLLSYHRKQLLKPLKCLGEMGPLQSQDWEEASEFVAIVDEWFDLFNAKGAL